MTERDFDTLLGEASGPECNDEPKLTEEEWAAVAALTQEQDPT